MPDPDDLATRRTIADRLIRGTGVEIGAGLDPSLPRGTDVVFIDGRTRSELHALFGAPVSYEVRTLDEMLRSRRGTFDFLIAHHVVEHCSNPIGQVMAWLPLLRAGGRLFVSIPSNENSGERSRVPVTISHLLHDHLFDRTGADFDSKQHIPHFIVQWTAMSPDSFWYAKSSTQDFCAQVLAETRRDDHDLHWHTYTLESLSQLIEAACWFGGHGVTWIHRETANGAHYVVADLAQRDAVPLFLMKERDTLVSALQKLS
jgi:SAM-dependent methyltransferase